MERMNPAPPDTRVKSDRPYVGLGCELHQLLAPSWEVEDPREAEYRTRREQRPRRGHDKKYEVDGIEATISAHAERLGIKRQTVYSRLRKGWPIQLALKCDKLDPIEIRRCRDRGGFLTTCSPAGTGR